MEDSKISALRIKEAMEDNNMTATDLAKKSGVNKGTISHYINGQYTPSSSNISVVLESQHVRMPEGIHLPAKVRPGLYIPSEAEVKTLLSLAKGTELELPIRLAISVPARRGERKK